MTEADADDTELDGLAIERAVDIVGTADADPGELRETLAIVAEDGVVSRAAVDDALANASMVVTTAETRVELAGDKLDNARATAPSTSDLAFVSDRVDNFDTRLAHIETRADDLGEALQEVLSMKADGDLYEIARRIRRLTNAATEVQQAADDLQLELDTFESWLTDADRRVDELTADIDALADSLSELSDVVDQLEARGTGDDSDAGDDADDAENDPESEAASRWAAARVRHRVLSLMLTDLHAELTAVQTWAEREAVTSPSEIEPRLDEIQDSHTALGERLTACADPEWTARFDEQLTALDEALTEMEPPVVWADVDAVVAEHRPAIE
ncbi:halo transducer protein [Halonotius roseus]|uniref:Halo transducer protein n=1 Tax=Halonotius roseus TaxID=2511997 RepID=A0A544QP86_9EURY|nr:halo transducer protein [Halonotius roseus]TQQ80721.1 halo transducer protein [Halonotius roseus]